MLLVTYINNNYWNKEELLDDVLRDVYVTSIMYVDMEKHILAIKYNCFDILGVNSEL